MMLDIILARNRTREKHNLPVGIIDVSSSSEANSACEAIELISASDSDLELIV